MPDPLVFVTMLLVAATFLIVVATAIPGYREHRKAQRQEIAVGTGR